MSYIQTDMTSTETTLRARIAELESALRLTLAVSPDDPLVLTPAEQQVVGLEAQVAGLSGCCKDYVENIKIIDSAFLMAWVHGAKKGYTGKQFVYCPWCSLKLIYEKVQP